MIAWLTLGAIAVAAWVYLLAGRGLFWMMRERDDRDLPPEPAAWPAVVAVVPARNEADVIARSVGSLLAQDYPGAFRLVLVDDNSEDGTGAVAEAAAARLNAGQKITGLSGQPLAKGWTGKLWAVSQGVERACADAPTYLWITDADIEHDPQTLRRLVARAEAGQLTLVTLMARLQTGTWPERLMIPAFVFFFDMLFPFGIVNNPKRRLAAAAGGCMLVRRTALEAAGGIASIRAEIIDDCALGARLKAQGPIWLGLTRTSVSLRPYLSLGEIGRMVSRSAYAQLRYSPWLLAGTLIGMCLVYLAAPIIAVFGDGWARWLGVAAWVMMAGAFQPMLRYYRLSPLWGLAMPLIGALYSLFTVQSAVEVWRGRGGMWKGRTQALAAQP
ncbi:MAG TPA: glycosyltransferase [Caulobacteraceae bacterium]|jgi:hopene-associated glycosyltransferase HpnB|nr:glycosyltransferase [Caulobacteraceae bacterium]